MRFFGVIVLLYFQILVQAQTKVPLKTIVSGTVLDAKTNEALEYVNLQTNEGTMGVSTDQYGRFLLETSSKARSIKVSYIGYTTQRIDIKNGEKNELTIRLISNESQLSEITVRPEKYKKKNPAVDLIQQVFLHKDQNRKEGLPYCQFDTYEKLRFDVNGMTTKFKEKWFFRPFQYAFTFCDTNSVNQKVTLPFYLRERRLTSYYRRVPFAKKEKLWAERQTALEDDYDIDNEGISTYINNMSTDIDIYEPTIKLLDKEFMGPLAQLATSFYRFYITDTISLDNQRFASVFFAPYNKNDLAFTGTILVALDSSYAVRRVDMGVSKDININWVKEIKIRQDYEFQNDGTNRRLLLSRDEVVFDLKVWKNKEGRSLLATKKNTYHNYVLNKPQSDTLYKGKVLLLRDTGKLEKTPLYWTNNRFDSLNLKDKGVNTMVDSIKSMKLVKRLTAFGNFMASGHFNVGKLQLGNLTNFYRYNDVEGPRLQLSLRTNDRYSKHFRASVYGAYGTRDKEWKYGASTTFAFNGARPGRFPVNQVKIGYEKDLFLPGLTTSTGQNFVSSLQTTRVTRLLWNQNVRMDYSRELNNGISFAINTARKAITESIDVTSTEPNASNEAITTEVGGWIRFAANEKFFQNREDRISIRSKNPVFMLQYRAGLKGVLGGKYAYQRASIRADKVFYVAPFGKSRWMAECGQIFGQVSYPFLEIHRANRSYFFDDNGFNLMNYLEFVSDRYAMLHINHDFEGVFLNRIPLIKKLRLREGVTFKALYGSLSDKNVPTADNALQSFPLNLDNQPITQSLSKKPYMECSAGIGNIFGFLRLDYVWRLSYKNNPNVNNWGLKLQFSTGF